MGGVILLNSIGIVMFGTAEMVKYTFITMSIPSFIYFFIMSKYRDGRLIFAFCTGDIYSMIITGVTGIIGAAMGDNVWFIFFSRLILFPFAVCILIIYLRKFYKKIIEGMKRRWSIIAATTVLFYIMLIVMISYPEPIVYRYRDVPFFVLLILLIILTYVMMASMIRDQLRINQYEQTEKILSVQVKSFEKTIQVMEQNEKKMNILQHDLRHYENSIRELLQDRNIEDAMKMLGGIENIMESVDSVTYCSDRALNAVFVFYIELAHKEGCKVTTKIDPLKKLPVDTAELCIVFSNALENAINACKKIEDLSKREIKIICIEKNNFAIGIYNTYAEPVFFSDAGLPVSDQEGHGYGTQSIQTFAQKHHAVLDYDVTEKWFKLRLIINE